MVRSTFNHSDFLDAALALVAEGGPSAVTVASITGRLKAPIGSFYHRFASRDALLGELWLRTVLAFQQANAAAYEAGGGLAAALHVAAWVREHLDEACLLLLYHRDDFIHGEWPQALKDGVAEQTRRFEAGFAKFARATFGDADAEAIRRAQFVLAEMPVAAVRQHLLRREKPPPLVDELIRETYRAIVAGYNAGADGGTRTRTP
jgi:AcrR family transcriptional regulator